MARDMFTCYHCNSETNTLNVHHRYYIYGNDPWDYPDDALVTLCAGCHGEEENERKLLKEALVKLNRVIQAKEIFAYQVEELAEALRNCHYEGRYEPGIDTINNFLTDVEEIERLEEKYIWEPMRAKSSQN